MERETIEDTVRKVGATADATTQALASANLATKQAGETMESAGERLRNQPPGSGRVGDAADALSQGLKHRGQYLRENGMSGIVEDLEVLIRRYPIQTLLLGMGFGFLLSRLRPQ